MSRRQPFSPLAVDTLGGRPANAELLADVDAGLASELESSIGLDALGNDLLAQRAPPRRGPSWVTMQHRLRM